MSNSTTSNDKNVDQTTFKQGLINALTCKSTTIDKRNSVVTGSKAKFDLVKGLIPAIVHAAIGCGAAFGIKSAIDKEGKCPGAHLLSKRAEKVNNQ